MSEPRRLLAARGVSRRYGERVALRATDVDLCAGEAIALLGPNGAGKSTLLSILAGALPASDGTVDRADGVRVGWMPQRPAHYGRLSARENLELFARLEREADARAAAARLLERLELPQDDRPSAALSVGNRQRLNLALSLLGSPDVLLLDEPTAALDPRQRRRLWETAAELRGAGGTVVFATQNLEDVARLADRVVLIVEGAVVFDGPVEEYERSQAESALA